MISRRFLLTSIALSLALPAMAADVERSIMTGGPKGTYIQIGRDIARLAESCGKPLNVVESAGSLENFAAVRNRRNTQFGIVQSDVLDYLKTFEAEDKELQKAVRGVRIMFPLYNEEVHVLARREIGSLKDLAGKTFAVGKKDSGTYLTSSLMLDILQVKGGERLAINPDEALPRLLSGEIDALFYVAGAPASLFASADIDPAKFHLVPVKEEPLLASYILAKIEGGTYPFQKESVDAVAVKAVLMTFDYDAKGKAYQRQSCTAVADISNLILGHLSDLTETGHPKWKQVDLTALPPGWKVGNCVKIGMQPDYDPQCKGAAASGAEGENDDYLKLLKQRLSKP